MTPAELSRIGNDLYGPLWKAKLAHELGRSRFTVGRWAAGKTAISAPAAKRIRQIHATHCTAHPSKDAQP